ncbi:hypothetical protein BDZ45DRAFT_143283 [Acephala macrosclerotiorum]|nr:hypothetical protein BDZ45DRAFT_143283 [Acephala macrosclerotiorum]
MGKIQSKIPPKKPEGDFYLFPYLPAEIRMQIWEAALPSRIINIHAVRGRFFWSRPEDSERRSANWIYPFEHVWVDKVPVPSILQVNRESREVGLRHYQLLFDSNSRPNREDVEHRMPQTAGSPIFAFETSAMIYYDPERDLFHPQADETEILGTALEHQRFLEFVFFKVLPRQVLERIRFIVMYAEPFRLRIRGFPRTDEYLKVLTGLRGIVVIRQAHTNAKRCLLWNQYVDDAIKDWPVKPQRRLIRDKQNDPGRISRKLKRSLLWVERICYAQLMSQYGIAPHLNR